MKKSHLLLIATIFVMVSHAISQTKAIDNSGLQSKFRVVNRKLTSGTVKDAMHMDEVEGAGIAWLTDRSFTNGVIEFDVKGKDLLQKSFVGVAFHGVNDSTYEVIYFRPFNFRSDDAVRRSHGVQYIAIPGYDWPKLREEFPNKYEQEIIPAPDPNNWFHARITVNGRVISVYVNNNAKPALIIESLVNFTGRQIGYWAGNGSGGDWKNLTVAAASR